MAYGKGKRKRDRQESDLLLNAVLAHMAFSSAKDYVGRKMAHDRFKDAVRVLLQFVTAQDLEAEEFEGAHS